MTQYSAQTGQSAAAGISAGLLRFEGSADGFLRLLLEAQLRISGASAGAVVSRVGSSSEAARFDVLASAPIGASPEDWLAFLAGPIGRCIDERRASVTRIDEQRAVVVVPLMASDLGAMPGGLQAVLATAVGAYLLEATDLVDADAARERLELSTSLLGLLDLRLALQAREQQSGALVSAVEVLAAVNAHEGSRPAAAALVSQLATRLKAERVSVGFLQGRYARALAITNTDRISRASKLVQDIEGAMEEAIDQDEDVLHPRADQATFVARQAEDLSRRHGPMSVAVMPLRVGGAERGVVGAIVVERLPQRAIDGAELEWLRLVIDLVAPRLLELHEADRWVGAKLGRSVSKAGSVIVGPRHTGVKLVAALAMAFLLWAGLTTTPREVRAPFVLESAQRRIVPAPFDGFLREALVKVGDEVHAGQTVLARLDITELGLKLAEAQAQRAANLKQAEAARASATGDPTKLAEAQIAMAGAEEAAARIALIEGQMKAAELIAPMDGVVASGELDRMIGSPVKMGETLFEIAMVRDVRAVIAVPENKIAGVQDGQHGELASASYPERRIAFTVERIDPAAEVVGGRNIFRVRAKLDAAPPEWMRPGMEGAAAISAERASRLDVWTRDLVNWVRMRLWW